MACSRGLFEDNSRRLFGEFSVPAAAFVPARPSLPNVTGRPYHPASGESSLLDAGAPMADYKVQFELFEGPLDLLLYLVRKEEVDIYQINLTKIAKEFIEYVELMRELDLEIAGEFLVMASTLMYIKSRELLPVDKQVTDEEDEEEGDPRWELIRQLVEYKKFKDVAETLRNRADEQEQIYARIAPKPDLEAAEAALGPDSRVSIFDLVNAVNAIIKRFDERDADRREIYEDKWTVSEKIEHIRVTLTNRKRLRFTELFANATSRSEVVVTFLAMLELIRMRQMRVDQNESFGEIDIVRVEEEERRAEDAEREALAKAEEEAEARRAAEARPQSSLPLDTRRPAADEPEEPQD